MCVSVFGWVYYEGVRYVQYVDVQVRTAGSGVRLQLVRRDNRSLYS